MVGMKPMRTVLLNRFPRGRAWLPLVVAVTFALGAGAACSDDDGGIGDPDAAVADPDAAVVLVDPVVRFTLAPGNDFFSQPWPSDLRLTSEGKLDLTGFPEGEVLVQRVIDTAAAECTGFAMGGTIYFSFNTAVDPASLPGEGGPTLEAGASVYLVNVDTTSEAYGERTPLWIKLETDESRFIAANWLGLLPFPGFPLRPGTTYAAVITNRVLSADRRPMGRDADFAAIMGTSDATPAVVAARGVYQPLLDYLADQSLAAQEVVGAAVFTTHTVTEVVRRAREVIAGLDVPTITGLGVTVQDGVIELYDATYLAPIFQQGEAPYRHDGGQIEVDALGDPVLARMEELRVAISVPVGIMPATGWPVVIYRHGTGGDYKTFYENGTADRIANAKDIDRNVISQMAVVSIDGVVHGPRAAGSTAMVEELFYNFGNPLAGRDNSRQEAIDNFQLVRLVSAIDVAAAPETGSPIKFDPDRIYYLGHSQGGITGALFVPHEPHLAGAVLSGTGAHLLLTLLRKETEFSIGTLLELALNDGDYGPVDEMHPALNVLQTFIEPADPLGYVRTYLHEPPGGIRPLNLMLTYGVGDTFTPNLTTETLAVAAGISPAGTVTVPYASLELAGAVTPLSIPVCDNYTGATGTSSAVVVQYEPWGYDGHFVVFNNPVAWRQAAGFLATHAADGCATLIE